MTVSLTFRTEQDDPLTFEQVDGNFEALDTGKADTGHTHVPTEIVGSTSAGRTMLTAADATAQTALLDTATTSLKGLMSSSDKTKLDAITGTNTGDETASGVLTKIKTVDGDGSGLDADKLDGLESTDFALASHTQLAATISDSTSAGRAMLTAANAAAQTALLDASGLLAKILSVDGSGSTLDADKLDGIDSTGFALASHTQAASTISDSTTAGRALLTATDVKAQRAALLAIPVVALFGADVTGATASDTAFANAAAAGTMVELTAGTYKIDANVSGTTRWLVDKGASVTGKTAVGTNSYPDMSRLGGRVVHFWDSATRGGVLFGDPDPWPEIVRNPSLSLAELAGVTPGGQVGVFGASRTSDSSGFNMAGIGLFGLMNNDSTGTVKPGWAQYLEARRQDGAGATFGAEIDMINFGTTADLNPHTTRSNSSQDTINVAFTCGGGGGIAGSTYGSAAAAIYDNGQKFRRGFVFMTGAIDSSYNEVLAMDTPHRLAWYDSSGLQSWLSGTAANFTAKSDTAANGVEWSVLRKSADGVTATGNLFELFRLSAYSYTGSADYAAGYIQFLQRGTFSGGQVRTSLDMSVTAADGSTTQVTINGLADKTFAPNPDNTISLGTSSFRWSQLFLSSYMELAEISAPTAPAADRVRLFAKDNGSGKTQVIARFNSGADVTLATQA